MSQSLQVMLRFLKASCKTYQTTDSNTLNWCLRIKQPLVLTEIHTSDQNCLLMGSLKFQWADLPALCWRRKSLLPSLPALWGQGKDLPQCRKLHPHPGACKTAAWTGAGVFILWSPSLLLCGYGIFFPLPCCCTNICLASCLVSSGSWTIQKLLTSVALGYTSLWKYIFVCQELTRSAC